MGEIGSKTCEQGKDRRDQLDIGHACDLWFQGGPDPAASLAGHSQSVRTLVWSLQSKGEGHKIGW